MESQYIPKEEPGLHLSVLRLLNSPLRLICATIWRVVQEVDVLNYGILEEFMTSIVETVPDLLSQRQWAQLILGLRAKVVLELCRCESSADSETIQHHLDRIRLPTESSERDADVEASESNFLALVNILLSDPVERNIFFEEVFPVEYGPKYDLALQRLISIFVSRFEEILPIPGTDKVAAMLGVAPSVMEECFQTLSHPQELLNSLSHLKNHSDIKSKASSPPQHHEEDDYIFSCLSHPPILQVAMDTEHKACEIEFESSYCEDVTVECEGKSASATRVNTEDVKPEKEMREELVRTADCHHGGVYGHSSHHQKQVCGDKKDDSSKEAATSVEGPEEPLRSNGATSMDMKFIREDGVVVNADGMTVEDGQDGVETTEREEGLLSAETQPTVQVSKSVHSSCETVSDNLKNRISHQRQLTVKLERVDITGKPLPPPLTRQSSRVRKKRVRLLWRKNKGPEITWIVPDDEPQQSPKPQHLTTSLKADGLCCKPSAVVFACSKCSFHDGSEASLHQHLMKNHPDEFSRLLSAGFRQKSVAELQGNRAACASGRQVQVPKRGVVSKKCPVCAKTFTRATDMRRHLKGHVTEQLHFCSGCGRCFQHIDDLRRHTAVCKEIIPPQPNLDPLSQDGKELETTSHNDKSNDSCNEDCRSPPEVGKASTSTTEQTGSETVDPRVCPVCNLVLARASDMERHMRSHSAEKPYECLHCSKSYRYPYNLKKHVDMCHKELNPPVKESSEHPCDSSQDQEAVKLDPTPCDVHSKVCPTCRKIFTRATDMRRHQKCHTGLHFECLKCGESFPQSLDLEKHKQNSCTEPTAEMQGVVSSKRPLACGTCGKKFFFLTHFQRHMRAHRQANKPTKRWHKCAKCEEIFRTLYDLGKHQRCHWGDDPLRCTQCGRRFNHSIQLASHKQIHSQVCTMKCTMCEETFNEITSFRLHYIQTHNIKGSYPCSHCKKTFTEVCPLLRHLRAHTGERPYQCPQCSRSFPTPAKLSMHKQTYGHGGSVLRERRHLCHECGKRFYTPAELKRHEGSHCEERPHMCTHCGKGFKEPRTLKAHMECHVDSQERLRYPCSYCGKTFIKAGALVRHNRIHTGERPHRCSECNKTFLTHSEVLKHMRFHTGERPFKCQVCCKGFTQSCYLTAHMRTHTGERPYACSVCEKRFSDSAHRKRHMLIHTGEKPHVCERCGRAFNRKNLLNVHLKTCM